MVHTEAAAMLGCSSILGNSGMLWERVCEQLMTVHCILIGVCLRKAQREALKQRQRKNTQFMSLTLIFWGALWFSDFATHNPVPELLVPKLLKGLQGHAAMWTWQMWGAITCQGAAEKGGIPEGAQCHDMSPRWFRSLSRSQAEHVWKAPLWGSCQWVGALWRTNVLHIKKATPVLGSGSLAMGGTALTVNNNSNGNDHQLQWYWPSLAAVSLRCSMEKPSANASLVGSKVWMHFCSDTTVSVPSWFLVLPSKSLWKELQPTVSHLRREDRCFKEQLFATNFCWHYILAYFKCRDSSYCFSACFSDYAGEKKSDHTETTFCKVLNTDFWSVSGSIKKGFLHLLWNLRFKSHTLCFH